MGHAIPQVILCAFAGIWGLLVLASVIVFALGRFNPQKDYRELALRTRSWWIMVAIFTVIFMTSRTAALCFLGFISFLALKEFFSMIPTRRTDRRVLLWAYLAIPLQYYWAGIAWYGMFIVFIPIYMFILSALRMVMTQKTDGFLRAAGTIHWALMTTVFFLSHTAYLLMLSARPASPAGGEGLLLFLLILTELNDVFQYVGGKLMGKHKITPVVSPKKTWEGFISGIVATMLVSLIAAPYLTPFDHVHALGAGLLLAVSGFVGDVILSAIKRDIGVKDSGALIPGHGGILDRIDSLMFTAPQFFYFVCYFYGY